MKLRTAQLDRACGAFLATAAGDALGAGYEFGPPMPPDALVSMRGGGGFGWAPGEWTDDTSMAIAIAEVAASGADLREAAAQDAIVARWEEWAATATDVGAQTRRVLRQVRGGGAAAARAAAADLHARTGRSGGNGALMRTALVALAYLDDPDALVEAATSLAALTHFDPEAGESCVLSCLAIRHAVLTGELDLRVGLPSLAAERASVWAARIAEAEAKRPADFTHNGWTVQALQAAWSAIASTPVPREDPASGRFRAQHLRFALENAVRGGRDADTVAAIAGGLLGAAHGASAVPAEWRTLLHGWPGHRGHDLVELAACIVRRGAAELFDFDYPGCRLGRPVVAHPYDNGLLLGDLAALRPLTAGVDAVVSLCRVGERDAPNVRDWIEVRLIDRNGAEHNPNLDFVLDDTVQTIQRLRAAGRTVLLHCVQMHSRTPALAALYGMRVRGVSADRALADIQGVLPDADPIRDFRAALRRAAPDAAEWS